MNLNANKIKSMNEAGMFSDGKGLYLKITKSGTKSWIHRYKLKGRRRDMGLGTLDTVSLKEARGIVTDNHKLIDKWIDPIDARKKLEQAETLTFDECAEQVIASKESGWKNPKSSQQWKNSLKTYASPILGNISIDQISTEHVLEVLKPIWTTKNVTATRVRERIEDILNWAKVMGYRSGENPALWRGHFKYLLAKPSDVHKVKHHKAMPYRDISNFMAELKPMTSISAKALQFTILTGCRTKEVIGAVWDEIDMDQRTWTVPAPRMKMKRRHIVPLSNQAMSFLESLPNKEGWLFPSPRYGKHISDMAMLNLVKHITADKKLTVHGFRSSFRDWTAEETSTLNHVAEMALAHAVGSGVEKSYRRGELLAKRAKLMQQWGNYCDDDHNNSVVSFPSTGAAHV